MKTLHHLQVAATPASPALLRCSCTLAALLLAGCASAPKTERVEIPVAVPCVGEVPARPINTFGTGAYPGDKAAAQAALIDSAAWEGYATKLEVIIAGCSK